MVSLPVTYEPFKISVERSVDTRKGFCSVAEWADFFLLHTGLNPAIHLATTPTNKGDLKVDSVHCTCTQLDHYPHCLYQFWCPMSTLLGALELVSRITLFF